MALGQWDGILEFSKRLGYCVDQQLGQPSPLLLEIMMDVGFCFSTTCINSSMKRKFSATPFFFSSPRSMNST